MDAFKERKYFQKLDKSFKITLFLERFSKINSIFFYILHFLCLVCRKIYSTNKKSGIIVIINLHRLGDTVFSIPAITEIFNYYKDYKIFIFCFSETEEILSLRFNKDNLHTINKNDFYFYRRIAKSKIRRKIKFLNPEIIIDLTGIPSSASMVFNSRAHTIIGMNYHFLRGLYNKFVDIRDSPHYIDKYLDVIRLFIPSNYVDKDSDIKKFSKDNSESSRILVHPFAIRKAKEWNLNRYISLVDDLKEDYDVKIISPPNFIPMDIKEDIYKKEIPFSETQSVKHLIEEIRDCSLFISNDSGPTYIASLLGKATFTIYGPTNHAYSLPFGKHHRYIRINIQCSPVKNEMSCFTIAGIFCPSYECIQGLSLNSVKNEIRKFITELGISKRKNDFSPNV